MKSWILILFTVFANVGFANESVVEGKIAKVVPAKTEIYVKENKSDTKHEYYFTKETKVVKGGKAAQFSDLKEGQAVRVTAKKVGKRLDPQQVEILE